MYVVRLCVVHSPSQVVSSSVQSAYDGTVCSYVRYAVGVQTLGPKELQSMNSARRALIVNNLIPKYIS
jgi:hypothetical protein